jgi:hypothetical protein
MYNSKQQNIYVYGFFFYFLAIMEMFQTNRIYSDTGFILIEDISS